MFVGDFGCCVMVKHLRIVIQAHAIMVLAGDSDSVRSSPIRTVEREKEKATPHVMAASPTTNCNTSTINHITPNGFSSPAATASKSPLTLSVASTPATNAMPEVKPQTATAVRRPQAGIGIDQYSIRCVYVCVVYGCHRGH
jgi:hypothetical protein